MNIETANRLCNLRKKHNLSQEQLAEKIGVSRQAVSKWERAEASPDTDNLITLAQIYNISIDEILMGKKSINVSDTSSENKTDESKDFSKQNVNNNKSENYNNNNNHTPKDSDNNYKEEKTRVSFKNGIHVDDGGDHVHIGWDGIHVQDSDGTQVHIDSNGVFVDENGNNKVFTDEDGHIFYKDEDSKRSPFSIILNNICIPILAIIIFLVLGFGFNSWEVAWLIFLALPLYYSMVEAIEKRKLSKFCYPVFVVILYLALGLCLNLWHPAWILFLTIPIFYGICGAFKELSKTKKDY